jgi:hypothetical protein
MGRREGVVEGAVRKMMSDKKSRAIARDFSYFFTFVLITFYPLTSRTPTRLQRVSTLQVLPS